MWLMSHDWFPLVTTSGWLLGQNRVETMSQGLQMVLDAQQSGVALGRAVSSAPRFMGALSLPTNGAKGESGAKDETGHMVVDSGQSEEAHQLGLQRGLEEREQSLSASVVGVACCMWPASSIRVLPPGTSHSISIDKLFASQHTTALFPSS